VRQCIQELIYNLNVPSRWGTQTPFTNLTFDWTCPEDLRDQVPVIGGVEMDFTYGDLQAEMDMINRAYMEVMIAGDAKGRVFTFPIPTYNITPDFPWESENATRLFEMTAKYGLPYFQNFVNSELKPNMVRSMCCRLQLDLTELLKRGNGLFGSAEQTGSVGVVTVNCARLGFLHKGDEAALFARLDDLLDIGRTSLEIKRKVIQRHMDAGLFPYTKRYLGTLRNHFSTLGVNGLNEMIRNFTDDAEDISTPWGHAFALRFLDHVRAKMVAFQEETGHLYNLEATPAEGTTYRFAREDRKRFDGILQAGTDETPYYTNSSQLPVGFTDDPFEALTRQEPLQAKYTGGTVLHLYMGERISSAEACKKLVRRALENFRIPYITVTPTFSICPTHGYIAGEHKFCPICDEERLAAKRARLGARKAAA
jgi:ribonucleoside-triphosphate reductase